MQKIRGQLAYLIIRPYPGQHTYAFRLLNHAEHVNVIGQTLIPGVGNATRMATITDLTSYVTTLDKPVCVEAEVDLEDKTTALMVKFFEGPSDQPFVPDRNLPEPPEPPPVSGHNLPDRGGEP